MREYASARLAPRLRERISAKADPYDCAHLFPIFARMPEQISRRLVNEWERLLATEGRIASNRYAYDLETNRYAEFFALSPLPFDATDSDNAEAAKRAARFVRTRAPTYKSEADTMAMLGRTARRHNVATPTCKTFSGIVARMCDASWWRRALRKRYQIAEHAAIRAGCVSRRAALYVSDDAYRRHERHARKNAMLLDSLDAVNVDTGETIALGELASHSLANPANRRAAMMVCIRGLEDYSKTRGCVGLMLTLTCPSRMHARDSSTGEVNPNYSGTSPRTAHRYLCKVWNDATRKVQRAGIDYFGVRVAEPHHDATPHFHVLAFVPPEREAEFTEIMREYALRDTPDEPGADRHRFGVARIDPKKGSAAGYVAKYVSKNIDGAGVGDDREGTQDASFTAPRAVVWARVWHARQFQFFGAGSITAFRELFRLDRLPDALEPLIGDLWRATRDNDFGAYVRARNASHVKLATLYDAAMSKRYPGEIAKRLSGIVIRAEGASLPLITRPDEWEIRPHKPPVEARAKAGFALPWTRFNNSAHVDYKAFYSMKNASNKVPNRESARGTERGEASRVEHRYPTRDWPIGKGCAKDSTGQKERKNIHEPTFA